MNDLEDVTNKPLERKVRILVDDQEWKNCCENENKRDREDSDDGYPKKKIRCWWILYLFRLK